MPSRARWTSRGRLFTPTPGGGRGCRTLSSSHHRSHTTCWSAGPNRFHPAPCLRRRGSGAGAGPTGRPGTRASTGTLILGGSCRWTPPAPRAALSACAAAAAGLRPPDQGQRQCRPQLRSTARALFHLGGPTRRHQRGTQQRVNAVSLRFQRQRRAPRVRASNHIARARKKSPARWAAQTHRRNEVQRWSVLDEALNRGSLLLFLRDGCTRQWVRAPLFSWPEHVQLAALHQIVVRYRITIRRARCVNRGRALVRRWHPEVSRSLRAIPSGPAGGEANPNIRSEFLRSQATRLR